MTNTVNDNWYEDFFQGINCELWEKAVTENWTKQEIEFLIDELNLKQGQQILDIPCGFGRHTIEFAKRGFNVTAIDISETYIVGLLEKIKYSKLNVNAIKADILTVSFNQKFSGAICMGNSFGYFNFDKMKLFVEKVSLSLEKGAKFIINSGMVAESALPDFSKNQVYTIDDIIMDISYVYDVNESCVISHIVYTKNNQNEKHSFKHYVYTINEIKRLLKQFGLYVVATYSSTSKAEFNLGDSQIYIVAEKR